MIITIAGDAGSGKSTVARILAQKLKMKHCYVGGIRRKMAEARGMTLEEFNRLGETEDFTDREVDDWQKKIGKTEDNFIMEGRTSFHFIPNSLKIYLAVDEEEGAKRIWKAMGAGKRAGEAENLASYEDVLGSLRRRKQSDTLRYKKYYNLNAYDIQNFDYVLDTTKKTINEVVEELTRLIQKRAQAQ